MEPGGIGRQGAAVRDGRRDLHSGDGRGVADVRGRAKLFFYKCGERRWYTSPSVGDPFQGSNTAKDYSPIYDPKLGLVVQITQAGFAQYVNVYVMRLEPEKLELRPLD